MDRTDLNQLYRNELAQIHQNNCTQYENSILKLSTFFIITSITIISVIKKMEGPICVNLALLKISWLLFCCAIIAVVIHFLYSFSSLDKLAALNEELEESEEKERKIRTVLLWLYYLSGSFFLAGVVLIVLSFFKI